MTRQLQAGPFSVLYEHGFIRRIMYGNAEVLRMIYFALRDHNWINISHVVDSEDVVADERSFRITCTTRNVQDGKTIMSWDMRIEGTNEGLIDFTIRGTTATDFRRNRAGFCILHPPHVAGKDCALTHSDGTESVRLFPRAIDPENPFKDLRAMAWEAAGTRYSLTFAGDIFETEDQRNWGDASYKTFCTPLDLPSPVLLKKGDTVEQRVTFQPQTSGLTVMPADSVVHLEPDDAPRVVPALGTTAAGLEPLSAPVVSALKTLRLSHYRVEVRPASDHWVRDFSAACEQAVSLGWPMEVALHLTRNEDEEIEAFLLLCEQNDVRPRRIIVFSEGAVTTRQEALDGIPRLRQGFPNARIGAGTDYNFTEINKFRFDGRQADFVSFSFSPQEHADDDMSIMENAATPAYMVESAKAIFGRDMSVHVSPVVMKRRYNPYARDPADWPVPLEMQRDPRLHTRFGAAWTFATLTSLIRGGASSITLFKCQGDLGLVSDAAQPYPVFETIKRFAAFQGKPVRVLRSSDVDVHAALLDENVLGVVNLADARKVVRWDGVELVLEPLEERYELLDRP